MSLVLTICHIIRLYKCEHCTLTYSNKITLVWFLHFFFYLGGRWFSKILRNIWGWYVKILTIPYRGGWVVWKRPETPLRNIKMVPNAARIFHQVQISKASILKRSEKLSKNLACLYYFVLPYYILHKCNCT